MNKLSNSLLIASSMALVACGGGGSSKGGSNNADVVEPVVYSSPSLVEVSAIDSLIENHNPSYVFNSDENGSISYGGECSGDASDAVIGDNVVVLNHLSEGVYSDCTITVTNEHGNSDTIAIPEFEIDVVNTVTVEKSQILYDVDYGVTRVEYVEYDEDSLQVGFLIDTNNDGSINKSYDYTYNENREIDVIYADTNGDGAYNQTRTHTYENGVLVLDEHDKDLDMVTDSTISYTVDANGYVDSKVIEINGMFISSEHYTNDADGNVTKIEEHDNDDGIVDTTYTLTYEGNTVTKTSDKPSHPTTVTEKNDDGDTLRITIYRNGEVESITTYTYKNGRVAQMQLVSSISTITLDFTYEY